MAVEKLQRVFGLDLLRSLAIIIVIIGHSNSLISDYFPNFPYIPLPDGVDLFFVLSGFLIGGIIIKSIEKNQDFNFSILSNFLRRRWLRTLPNYFLFLLLNVLLIQFGLIKGDLNKYFVTYLGFFQNFYKPYDFLFWESWSLSVEEWFYLSFPFVLLLLFKLKPSLMKIKRVIFYSIFIFISFSLFYRILNSNLNVNESYWDLYFRKLVLTRLDSIGFGLLGAFLKYYYSGVWSKSRNISFVIGVFILSSLSLATFYFSYNSCFLKTFYFTLIGFSILLLLPKFESLKNENIPFKPFELISKISYSMYLLHIPIVQIFSNHLFIDNKTESIVRYLGYWITVIILSNIVYRCFEKPFMNLRKVFS